MSLKNLSMGNEVQHWSVCEKNCVAYCKSLVTSKYLSKPSIL